MAQQLNPDDYPDVDPDVVATIERMVADYIESQGVADPDDLDDAQADELSAAIADELGDPDDDPEPEVDEPTSVEDDPDDDPEPEPSGFNKFWFGR